MNNKISIVMSYYNRLTLLEKTLQSIIKKSTYKNFEVVIVDDASRDDNRLDTVPSRFPEINFIIHRIDPKDKKHHNPCIPFNKGFKLATGNVVIIQNPECAWTGDLLLYASTIFKEGYYNSFPCYSVSEQDTKNLNLDNININLLPASVVRDGDAGWYNHPIYRKTYYHFASCIFKRDLDDLGGFDERYANGHGFDDNELIVRILRKGLKLTIDGPLVLHQYHYNIGIDNNTIRQDNNSFFHNVTLKETGWRANQ